MTLRIAVFLILAPCVMRAFAQDEYVPLGALGVRSGQVILSTSQGISAAGGCIIMGENAIRTSKWQRRNGYADQWEDLEGSEVEHRVCAYTPTDPGQYRLVGEFNVGGEWGKYSSINIIILHGNGEVELVLVEDFPDPPTSARPAGWGEVKRNILHR